jgi:septal ring factor EnvC (AmiA/AmiB activator)
MKNKDIALVSLTTLVALGLGVSITMFANNKLDAERDLINAQNDAQIADMRIKQSKTYRLYIKSKRNDDRSLELIEARELLRQANANREQLVQDTTTLKNSNKMLANEKAALQSQVSALQAEIADLETALQNASSSTPPADTESPNPPECDDYTGIGCDTAE